MDAVNDLRGCWSDNKEMTYVRFGSISITFSDHIGVSMDSFSRLEFNALLSSLTTNFGTSCSYEEYKYNLASKHHTNKKKKAQ